METFSGAAKSLSGSPLGIIALFIVLLYAFASLVTTFSGSFSSAERTPLIYFLVVFPFVVLGVFAWLVSQHSTSLYAPRDFQNEDHYVRTVALLAAAQARAPGSDPTTKIDVSAIIANVEKSTRPGARRVNERKQLLWVDDHPENNVLERQAFESAGFEITLSLSTEQALNAIESHQFTAIISDMEERKGRGKVTICCSKSARRVAQFRFLYIQLEFAEHKKEAVDLGAQGATSDPNELFRLVAAASR